MTIPQMILKLMANAVALIVGYWIVATFQPDIANMAIFYGMWWGMLAAHLGYLGCTKENQ